jgi:hypothetical protein
MVLETDFNQDAFENRCKMNMGFPPVHTNQW